MNGISLFVSKLCCRMYNPGTSNKIKLIPHGLSNVHLQRSSPSLATTRMLKHGVCSSSKSISKDVSGLLKSNARYSFHIGFATNIVARANVGKIVDGSEEDLQPFSVGDIIQVISVEGRVVEMRPTTTVLLGAEKDHLVIPNDLLFSQVITNKTYGRCYDNMSCEIGFVTGEVDKTHDISKEITYMLESNPYVFKEVEKPGCHFIESSNFILRCHLKHMDPDIYFTAKEDILQQAAEIIIKHGGSSGKCFYYSYY